MSFLQILSDSDRLRNVSNHEEIGIPSDTDMPVFNESTTITIQPRIGGEFPGTRRPIPVSTIDWRTTNLTQFTPMHGLDFLIGAEQLCIQQTVELNDLLARVESENRYTIRVPQGETLYIASEKSTAFQRMCFGSYRSFSMTLYDQTQQEAIRFYRRLACNYSSFGCYLQELKVWIPPSKYIGKIKQDFKMFTPQFSVINDQGIGIFKIEGIMMCSCAENKNSYFKILNSDGSEQIGSIHHQWDHLMVGYNLCLTFPSRSTASKEKALLLGAAFLLEYLYFERAKNSKCCRCI